MKAFASVLFVSSTAAWAGAMLFFSAVVLPSFFLNLERGEAGALAAMLFPKYFVFGTLCAAISAGAAAALWLLTGRTWRLVAVAAAAMLAVQLYAARVVHPEVAAIRGKAEHAERFDVLHRRSVRINGVLLVGAFGLLVWSGRRVARGTEL